MVRLSSVVPVGIYKHTLHLKKISADKLIRGGFRVEGCNPYSNLLSFPKCITHLGKLKYSDKHMQACRQGISYLLVSVPISKGLHVTLFILDSAVKYEKGPCCLSRKTVHYQLTMIW